MIKNVYVMIVEINIRSSFAYLSVQSACIICLCTKNYWLIKTKYFIQWRFFFSI